MEKLAEILHELISVTHGVTDNRRGELHELADQAAEELLHALTTPAPAEPAPPAVPVTPDGAAQA